MFAKRLAQAEIHVGDCTPGKQPGQWVVSCELRVVKKHNLAMRKDNPAKRYIVDGGFCSGVRDHIARRGP